VWEEEEMRPGGGRAKGASFERKVAKIIVAAFKHQGITGKHCYRTPLSGGHRYASKKDPGDLVISPVLKKIFPYSVECKSYARLEWAKLLLTPKAAKGHFTKWWKQTVRAAGLMGRPILVFRQNHSEIFVMMRTQDSNEWHIFPSLRTVVAGDHVRVFTLRMLLGFLGGKDV
jgi:hypothetical protein